MEGLMNAVDLMELNDRLRITPALVSKDQEQHCQPEMNMEASGIDNTEIAPTTAVHAINGVNR